MSVVPSAVLVRIRERLQRIHHPEVRLWNDEDLKTAVFENSSKWFELLKWLLIAFDASLARFLENVEESSMTRSLQDVVISLGLLPSEESHKSVSGKVCVVEREKMCDMIFSAIEKCSKGESNELRIPAKTEETDSFEEYRSFVNMLKKGRRKECNSFDSMLTFHEEMKDSLALGKELFEQAKVKYELPENLTPVEYLEQLKEKRKSLFKELVDLSSTVKHLWQRVIEMYKSELEPLLPENIDEARKMPVLKELSKNIDHLSQHQKVMETVKVSIAILQDRSSIDRELQWSVKNAEALPVNDCFKQVSSVNAQIMALDNNVNLESTSVNNMS